MDRGKVKGVFVGNKMPLKQIKAASKILAALDGMSISEARDVLTACEKALMCETVRYEGISAT